jgi:hypothetical protein
MSKTSKVLLTLLAVFIVIQFFRPEKNQSSAATPDDLFAHYPATDSLKQLIKSSCYDCHSNNTKYPWYAQVQPVAWWLDDHVKAGKRKFNFSEFATYPAKKADHKMEEFIEMVKEEEMPLPSYTLLHTNAELTTGQRIALTKWAAEIRKEIQPNTK